MRLNSSIPFQFDFVDAPNLCAATPGLDILFRPGNYTWYTKNNPQAIKEAHAWLLDYIDVNGPYDSVFCFSQGCSLIMSFLLYHARERPLETPPFRSAMFICGSIAFPILEDLGVDVTDEAWDTCNRTGGSLQKRTRLIEMYADNPVLLRKGMTLWDDSSDFLHDPNNLPPASDCFGLDFTKVPSDLIVDIPTVHIVGAKDPKWPAGIQLTHFCRSKRIFDHGGGHEIPRSKAVSDAIASLIMDLAMETVY